MSGEATTAKPRRGVLVATLAFGAPHEHERHRDGDESGQTADPQCRGEPARERSRCAIAVVNQCVEASGGDGRGDRHPDGTTELLRRADEPRGHACVRSVTPVRAPIETGMKANATPMPATKKGPARSAQKFPCGGIRVAHKMPAPMSAIPNTMTRLGENLVTSFWDGPAKSNAVTEATSQASPVLRAEKASTCCM